MAQTAHAGIAFALAYPTLAATHTTLVCVEAPDEDALLSYLVDFDGPVEPFREPDLNDAITAIAGVPGRKARRLLRRLPLVARGGEEHG